MPTSSSSIFCPRIPISKGNLVNSTKNCVQLATRPRNFTGQAQNLPQLKKSRKIPTFLNDGFEEPATTLTGSVPNRFFVDVPEANDRVTGLSESNLKRILDGEEEIGELMGRLEKAVEMMRVLEMEKLMGKIKGEVSSEVREVVEKMSREIINKFLERPMQYLRSEEGEGRRLEDKVQDLNAVVGMFERRCLR